MIGVFYLEEVRVGAKSAGETLYIVMPAYNEAENIRETLEQWYPILRYGNAKSRLVIAPIGSTDHTEEIIRRFQADFPQVEVLHTKRKEHGPKVIALYQYAMDRGADFIFQTDSDGQTSPAEFELFWKQRNEYDAILGNRVVRGDGKTRAFVEKVVCTLLRVYFGVTVPDANAPYRLMKKEVLSRYLPRFSEDYNLPNIMLTAFFSYYGEEICFKEISFQPRKRGVNSVNMPKIIKIGWKALKDFRMFKRGL